MKKRSNIVLDSGIRTVKVCTKPNYNIDEHIENVEVPYVEGITSTSEFQAWKEAKAYADEKYQIAINKKITDGFTPEVYALFDEAFDAQKKADEARDVWSDTLRKLDTWEEWEKAKVKTKEAWAVYCKTSKKEDFEIYSKLYIRELILAYPIEREMFNVYGFRNSIENYRNDFKAIMGVDYPYLDRT